MTSASSGVHSNSVSKCEVAGAKVTVTMGKDGAVDFVVVVLGSAVWAGLATDKITGNLKGFGTTLISE
jgi:uncharacterized protein (DUF983 family)